MKNPRGFNEKIAWRKLYQHDPRFNIYADKVAVKSEVAKLVGAEHVVETLWVGDRPQDIPYDTLPMPYVIKAGHSCGDTFFIRSATDIDRAKINASFAKHLNYEHGQVYREWGYLGVPKRILVERLIDMPDGEPPEDYKCFVYGGRVHQIQVDYDRFTNHTRAFYDRNWNRIPAQIIYPQIPTEVPRPAQLGQMIRIAETIGAQFDFIRVDLYTPPGKVLFGEATFYPGAGIDRVLPMEWEIKFGEPWKLPLKAQPSKLPFGFIKRSTAL